MDFRLTAPPDSSVNITYPAADADISRNSDLTITWDGQHRTGVNLVKIRVEFSGNSYNNQLEYFTGDTGIFTVSKDDLNKFEKNGCIAIVLSVGINKIEEISQDKYFIGEIFSKCNIRCNLTD